MRISFLIKYMFVMVQADKAVHNDENLKEN